MRRFFTEPFCGYPHGFHVYSDDVGDEDQTCVHCGRTRREIEGEDYAGDYTRSDND